jgi:hypothetical protein
MRSIYIDLVAITLMLSHRQKLTGYELVSIEEILGNGGVLHLTDGDSWRMNDPK